MSDVQLSLRDLPGRIAKTLTSLRSPKVVSPPQKILILQPCCLGQVMLTTPLAMALSEGYPEARIDWAVSDWALPAIGVNHRITRIIRTGAGELADSSPEETGILVEQIRNGAYDMCFVPTRMKGASRIVERLGIAHIYKLGDIRKSVRAGAPLARTFLSLAIAAGVDPATVDRAEMEFEPTDSDRIAVAQRLVEELDWMGDAPLAILHPGGGDNPSQTNLDKRWPAHRYARLGNHLAREHGMRVLITGVAEERGVAGQVAGMMSFPAANLAGEIGLGELGALSELADLYVGNDVGSTYVAAAAGAPTLTIFGPTDLAVSGPYMINGRVKKLRHDPTSQRPGGAFTWDDGVTVEEALAAVDELLATTLRASPAVTAERR